MKFFVPYVPNPAEADILYYRMKRRLYEHVGELEPDRYYELNFKKDGEHRTITVGYPLDGETVMAIFRKVDQGAFYICTKSKGIIEGEALEVSSRALGMRFYEPDAPAPDGRASDAVRTDRQGEPLLL